MIENGKKCLCTIEETPCMCDEFKEAKKGICHCGVFEYVEDEENG